MARGGSREGAGRPKGTISNKPKAEGRIVVSCLKEEEQEIKRLAQESGKNLSRYVLDILLAKN
ncbi:Uncharacterised protein [Anaerobiospirillum thomasii]|uniref:hypothetical protein n=1 Tax=Anaerobiospirillum thomasii TaxID=179995 RepID=UPI000D91AE52|nr:hypothetical protein [Anaerobiospirillum thomasii]SPT67594.1 Uncharacterised protein [Anaerobiospirillum thomasii]SPT71056.1 Uncharacterised protein [Anaerobiospirillum thomasii]SPT71303.1 Uncharacterised protein [Anaerobiospirillum thomasii]